MEWRRNAGTLRFTGNRAPQEVHFGLQLVPRVIQHGRRMIRLRANFVHFPGIFVKLDAQAGCYSLAFLNERVQQMAQIGELFFSSEMVAVRQFRQRGNGIDRGVENELRPLRRPRIFERHRFQP